jgi:hypothetical protein
LAFLAFVCMVACGGGRSDPAPDPTALAVGGRGNVTVVLAEGAPPYVVMAAEDLIEVVARRTGAAPATPPVVVAGPYDPALAPTGIVVPAGVSAAKDSPQAPDPSSDPTGG